MAEKKGYVAPDGRIFCWDEGFRCIVAMQSAETSGDFVFKFISAKMTADPTLDELSNRLNALVAEAHSKRKDPKTKLGVMSTGRGLVLVWKYDIPNDEDLGDYVDVSTLVCLDDKQTMRLRRC
jgi:hypothetical protein